MRRALVILVGLALAVTAGFLFLLIGGLAVPETRELAADLTLFSLFVTALGLAQQSAPDQAVGAVAVGLWFLTTAVLVAPPLLAAVIGELAGWRSFVWYGASAGLLAAALGFLGHPLGARLDPSETRVMLLLFLTGVVAGLVYWAVAGRSAGLSAGSGAA
jgi:hypothetical protein